METQRQLLEELDCLEAAAAQRFRRNPDLGKLAGVPTDAVLELNRKRPHRESLLQQHELRFFGERYEKGRARALENLKPLLGSIKDQKDPKLTFNAVLRAVSDLETKYRAKPTLSASPLFLEYAMYLSAPEQDIVAGPPKKVKRKHFLSLGTVHLALRLAEAFNESEVYGKVLDLSVFYEMYKTVFPLQITYGEYLTTFSHFPDKLTSAEYARYLEALVQYLTRMHEQCYPLKQLPEKEMAEEDGTPNSQGEVFCKACDKVFAKQTVYAAHLTGKKHLKNVKAGGAKTAKPAIQELENRVKQLVDAMSELVQATVADHERRSTLSDREKMLESLALDGEQSEYTAEDSNSEADEEEDNDMLYHKDLPIGTDGTPIPLWLYKLQGLHRTYNCEICGNLKYKGRQQFTKHFGQAKHVRGLTCLGVGEDETHLFDSIHRISEAKELWAKIQRNKRKEEEELDNVEIEDEEGNVMSHKDYVELKKQGLI